MRTKLFIFIALCFAWIKAAAQETVDTTKTDEVLKHKNVLSITPLRLAYLSYVGPELSYQRFVSERTSLQAKTGWVYAYTLPPLSSTVQDAQGGRLGVELKRFSTAGSGQGWYTAMELDGGYMTRNETYRSEVSGPRDPGDFRYDIEIMYASANIKLGYQRTFGRLMMDLFFGIGPRLVQVDYPGLSDANYAKVIDRNEPEQVSALASFAPKRGTYLGISVPLNVRLGYTF